MDQNVLNAQKYLNSMYGGNSNWVVLAENGNTGTFFIQGIVRAFQIENDLATPNGILGPATLAKMKSLIPITLMKPDDPVSNNVCLIQCALFAKGYNAGGITGIYYNFGMNAVKTFQADAGLAVTGTIDWKVWQGLLSLNWFFLTSGGSETLRTIQLMFNQNWSDYLGVGPCDGIMSRQTALSPLAALQAQEGLLTDTITDFNSLNFGPATSAACPGVLKINQSSGDYRKYNMIAQAALYFNGYNPGNFNGIFDGAMQTAVSDFQKFYALTGIDLVSQGEINLATMKSLLTSKGDTARKAYGCDTSAVLNLNQATFLNNFGYRYVGRYLTGTVGPDHIDKFITFNEIKNIQAAGLKTFLIYQDGGYYPEYFINNRQGTLDAKMAILAAKTIGAPEGSTIYFAVDYDFAESEVNRLIVNYFEKIHLVFISADNSKHYKVGIYAARQACSIMNNRQLADYSFVADMSTGFSGNLGHPIPKNWSFDQFEEIRITASSPAFDLDKAAVSGRDKGISTFDSVPTLSIGQQKALYGTGKEDLLAKIAVQQLMDSMWMGDLEVPSFSYTNKTEIANIITKIPGFEIEKKVSVSWTAEREASGDSSFDVSTSDGTLSVETSDSIGKIGMEFDSFFKECDLSLPFDPKETIMSIAENIELGNVSFEVSTSTDTSITLEISTQILGVESPELPNTYLTVIFSISLTADPEILSKLKNGLKNTALNFLIALLVICCFAYGPLVAVGSANILEVIQAVMNYRPAT